MKRVAWGGARVAAYAAAAVGSLILLAAPPAEARKRADASSATIAYAELPREAQHTVALIRAGGPFTYARKDGSVFGNRESRLPRQPRGYYREYTVTTPGASGRGARRVIAGSGTTNDVRTSGEYWYTDDHYANFRRIVDLPPQAGPAS